MQTPDLPPHRLVDFVRAEVDRAVSELRVQAQPLSVEKLAAALNVELISYPFSGPVRGAAIEDRTILLDDRLRGAQRAEVFGHEVAHVLHRRGWFRALPVTSIELFADQFARELLVPVRWLQRRPDSAIPLARRLGVGRRLLALQLAAAGQAPELMRDRNIVLCASCGIWPYNQDCSCRICRQDRHRRERLSDFRSLPLFSQYRVHQLAFEETTDVRLVA